MIKEIIFIKSNSLNPYHNLALEQVLFDYVTDKNFIVYLWRNDNTVVIGRHQNAFFECNVELLENDGGYLARRLTGGGAVYHDKGNVNFTFLASKENYSVKENFDIICKAIKNYGIQAKTSGRNDILADGYKFSGNAFMQKKDVMCHHGTILIDVNIDKLNKYLITPNKKVNESNIKEVKSVPSRVINLKKLNPKINEDNLQENILKAIKETYSEAADIKIMEVQDIDQDKLFEMMQFFEDPEFKFKKKRKYNKVLSGKFAWGQVQIGIILDSDYIMDANIFTDSITLTSTEQLEAMLKDQNIKDIQLIGPVDDNEIAQDIIQLIRQDNE